MDNVKQTVTRTDDSGIDTTGAPARQQTKHIRTERGVDASTTAQNIVWYILGLVELLVGLRFILKLLGANSANSFVNLIYRATRPLTMPFDSIFGVASATNGQTRSVFEPSILVAALVYALIAWGIVKLLTINQKTY